jgi:pyrroloquinoline-quinone synthase
MTIKLELDRILEKWDLLKHPFYQAWSDGTLPLEALRVYAKEYGAFIGTLSRGWEALGEVDTAREEQEHEGLWADFTASIGGRAGAPVLPMTAALVENALDLFASPPSALGALYAFEAQQPGTSRSKLEGLKAHYSVSEAGTKYFALHAVNWEESGKILEHMENLSHAGQAEAFLACGQMAESLWSALTEIHNSAMQGN